MCVVFIYMSMFECAACFVHTEVSIYHIVSALHWLAMVRPSLKI